MMSKSRSCIINSELNPQQQSQNSLLFLRSSVWCTMGHSVGRSSVTGTVSHGCGCVLCCFSLIENQHWGLLFLLLHFTFGAIRLLIIIDKSLSIYSTDCLMVKCNQTEDICSIQLFRIPPHLFKVAYFVPSFFFKSPLLQYPSLRD